MTIVIFTNFVGVKGNMLKSWAFWREGRFIYLHRNAEVVVKVF